MPAHPSLDLARRIGAIAGLAPAAALLIVLAILGARPNLETVPWLGSVVVVAVGAGGLIGPRITGALPFDLRMAVAFGLAGSLAYLVVGVPMSILAGPDVADGPSGLAWRLGGQLLYGLIYLPFLAGLLTPFGILWVLVVHALRRRAGLAPGARATEGAPNDRAGAPANPRRLAILAVLVIVAYGLFVAALPLFLYDETQPPWVAFRPVALFVLFAIPAAIGLVGAATRRRSLFVAAGVICLLQSYLSFSLVTLGFMVPALILLTLGGSDRWPNAARETRRSVIASIVVVGLTLGAWAATLAFTEDVCWSATRASNGSLTYQQIPVTAVMTVPAGGFASGCDGGTLTIEGMGVGGVLAVGAIAIAMASSLGPRREVGRG